jgi:BirA family biotin operon repressor/biotin-[acetyl-CoA-carboxylase] ligase
MSTTVLPAVDTRAPLQASTAPSAFAAALHAPTLEAALPGVLVEVVRSTGSTNVDLLTRARLAAPPRPIVRTALAQTAGRGRLGRKWQAAPGSALLFSIALPLAKARARSAAVTLACGVTVAETLRDAGVPVQLKWPNDVLLAGRKLAGILTELAVDPRGARTLIIGIGVNLWFDDATVAAIGHPVATLDECLSREHLAQSREAWIARLARAVLAAVPEFIEHGFAAFQPRFNRLFAYDAQAVEIVEHGAVVAQGIAQGVDADGHLLLATAAGVRAFGVGELSLRPRAAA